MYKEFTNEISGYKLAKLSKLKEAQQILKQYLIDNEVWRKDRDMTKEGHCFAKDSAFYSVFVLNGLLDKWYKPIYERISLSKTFMKELGFKTIKDDGIYGQAKDIRTNGMTVIEWNREGRTCTYFGDKLNPNIALSIKKDGGTRNAFNGYIFNERELKDLLIRTW